MADTLTTVEDADLRRLNELTRYALSAPMLTERLVELRDRDRRRDIRSVERDQIARQTWDDSED